MNRGQNLLTVCLLVGIAAHASALTPESGDAPVTGPLSALTSAALSAARDSEPAGFAMLDLLLNLPEPWIAEVLAHLESSEAVARWVAGPEGLSRDDRPRVGRLLTRMAEKQGLVARSRIVTLDADEIALDLAWAGEAPQWLELTGSTVPGDWLVATDGCEPHVQVYDHTLGSPALRSDSQIRLSPTTSAVTIEHTALLRLERNDCLERSTRVIFTRLGDRPRTTYAWTNESLRAIAPAVPIEVGVLRPVSFEQRAAFRFKIDTESGFVYTLYAAPLSGEVDPVIRQADPEDPARVSAFDDDGGYELGARLDGILGTGERQQFAVVRDTPVPGTVALLVTRRPLAVLAPDVPEPVELTEGAVSWRRLELTAGTWKVETQHLSSTVDPALIVYTYDRRRVLGENDDAEEGSLAASVTFTLAEPTAVLVKVGTLVGQGSCTLVVSRDAHST